jgi:hydroxymethylbilane synthase
MLRLATRGSALALWQAERVATLLGGDVEFVIVKTSGDERTDTPIHEMGGSGVFVKEVQQAVLDGRADLAQHSAKDLPAITPDGLPQGGRVGTGSVRRRAQLAMQRPDLTFAELRGNIGTRLERASMYDAIVVAAAALDRLGVGDRAAERLDVSVMLPMVGQGALAVECRADDTTTREQLAAIDDTDAHRAVLAERAFLSELGGGCSLPCAAYATVHGRTVSISALLAAPDGSTVVRAQASSADPAGSGIAVARDICAHGGRELLER